MAVILTVTLNAALDVTYHVDRLRPHRTHRVREVSTRPGGKGVNVAAVLLQSCERVVATGLCGGATGKRIRAGLAAAHIADAFVPVAGESRRTLVVTEESVLPGSRVAGKGPGGRLGTPSEHDAEEGPGAGAGDGGATGFWEPGPEITGAEWHAFLSRYRGLLAVARAVVLSGSLPRGLPEDAYGHLVSMARELAVPSILDAEGSALRAGVAAGPDVVKPNLAELASVTGTEPHGIAETLAAARRLRDAGADAVVVSRGPDGLLASTADGEYRSVPPEPVSGNPTGAGDAAVAALARGLAHRHGTAHRYDWPRMLADAVALSAAAVAAPLAGSFDEASYDRLRRAVTAEPVEEHG